MSVPRKRRSRHSLHETASDKPIPVIRPPRAWTFAANLPRVGSNCIGPRVWNNLTGSYLRQPRRFHKHFRRSAPRSAAFCQHPLSYIEPPDPKAHLDIRTVRCMNSGLLFRHTDKRERTQDRRPWLPNAEIDRRGSGCRLIH